MLSQIQPHFLYNSLTAIYELCDDDPEKAKSEINRFSSYLRFNMDSLTQKSPVAFSTELNHVKNYLELEKTRYEERLNVVYNIDVDAFMLPSLTVQPLVENAVKYGISKRTNGGTITISSREEAWGYVVTVEDNCRGFDVEARPNDGHSHIGIENVKSRLEMISGAELKIKSVKGEGTTAEIIIHKECPKDEASGNR